MAKDYSHLPVWLRRQLRRVGLTPEKFGQRAKVSRISVYAYLSDRSRPSEQTMAKICRVLGVPFAEGLRQYTPKAVGNPNFGPDNPYVRGPRARRRR